MIAVFAEILPVTPNVLKAIGFIGWSMNISPLARNTTDLIAGETTDEIIEKAIAFAKADGRPCKLRFTTGTSRPIPADFKERTKEIFVNVDGVIEKAIADLEEPPLRDFIVSWTYSGDTVVKARDAAHADDVFTNTFDLGEHVANDAEGADACGIRESKEPAN